MSDPILRLTDGTAKVSLLTGEGQPGLYLDDWIPIIADYKEEGIWRNSSLADGRHLVDYRWANVVETYSLKATDYDQDSLSRRMQDIRRLLEKATSYWASPWQDVPVWIEARAKCETNTRYGLIYRGRVPQDDNPYVQPFFAEGNAVLDDLALEVERLPWWLGFAPLSPCYDQDDRSESVVSTESGCDPSYLTFNGDTSVVSCGSDTSLDDIPDNAVAGRGQITVECWAKIDGDGGGSSGRICQKGNGLRFYTANTGLTAIIACATQNATARLTPAYFPYDGRWHHISMTYDETGASTPAARTIYLAIDGVWATAYDLQQPSIGNYTSDGALDLHVGNTNVGFPFNRGLDGSMGWIRVSDIIRHDPAGGNFTPDPRCTPPSPSTGTMLLLRHSPGYGGQTDDYSGYNNDGALTSVQWDCNCHYSIHPCWPNYLEFNGETSLVTVLDNPTIRNLPGTAAHNDQITVEAWIRARSYGKGAQGRIAVKGSDDPFAPPGPSRGWHFFVDSTTGLLGYVSCDALPAISGMNLGEFSADGLWHHVLMCYDQAGANTPVARTVYLAVDGVWTAVAPTQASLGAYTSDMGDDLIIGNNAAGTFAFDGDIGWIRVHDDIPYDPAAGNFTPELRCALPAIDSGVVVQVIYEGAGVVTYDRSGNGNDGTITEAVWDCDCAYTDENDVECNCVQASGEQDWEYEAWQLNTNQPVTTVTDIIELTLTPGRLLAADDNGEVWRSDDGRNWVASTTPPAMVIQCLVEDTDTGYVYAVGYSTAGGVHGEVWRSTDGGVSFVLRTNTHGSNTPNCVTYNSGDGYLYMSDRLAITSRISRSNDGGATWVSVYSGDFYSISASGSFIVAGDTAGVIRSANGTAWSRTLVREITFRAVKWLSEDGFMYALGADVYGHIYRSPDGIAWAFLSTTPYTNLYDIVVSGSFYYVMVEANATVLVGVNDQYSWKESGQLSASASGRTLQVYSANGLVYAGESGDIWNNPSSASIGRSDTCLDEVFVVNKKNIAQLTDIFVYDASTVTYVSQLPAALFPYFLLPSPFAVGDITYFGIDPSLQDGGPFCSLIFDLYQELVTTGATTLVWEYSQGGGVWATLNVHDETVVNDPLEYTGVRGVFWVPPSDWATDTVNGATCFWVRLRVTALGVWVQSPLQQYRDVYTITWPDVDIDDAQVSGDIPALLKVRAHNRSDEDYYSTVDELDLLCNRLLIGLRTMSRGTRYVAYINIAGDLIVANTYSQNPIGIYVVTHGIGTTTVTRNRAPAGICAVHTTPPTGSVTAYADTATITLGPSIARDFYGTYHMFLRAQLEEPGGSPGASGDDGDVRVRIKVQSGSGGISRTTPHRRFVGWDENGGMYKDFQLLDFGRVNLPVTDLFKSTELPDQFTITIQISSASGTNLNVNLYDLILIPVDEWAGDFIDSALEDDSGVGNGYRLDIDSLTYPKRRIRSLVRSADASEFIKASYQPITPGPAILQANADQRLHFLSARAVYLGIQTGALSGTDLEDTNADFLRAGVKPGMIAYNVTTGNDAVIEIVNQRDIVTDAIVGDWNNGDKYMVICNGIYRSEPSVVHSIQLLHNPRYLSFRGNR